MLERSERSGLEPVVRMLERSERSGLEPVARMLEAREAAWNPVARMLERSTRKMAGPMGAPRERKTFQVFAKPAKGSQIEP